MYELIVIGAGPAGLAAALEAKANGLTKILLIERDKEAGGILNQCIHNGFGLHYFKEELTGPEYAGRFIKSLENSGIELCLDTMVLEVTHNKEVHTVSANGGYRVLTAKAIVLAMGCRERTRGAIGIPGTRPSGIFTAGAAQRYINIEGRMVGKRVIILGSGDIGLIMARRLTLEGAKVLACVEVMPYSGGLTRNIVQCLQDYDIPLYLSHTITDIKGDKRVEKVTVAKVDENRRPISGTEMEFDCDTILLSVGLIPENELTKGADITIDKRTNGAVVCENMETSVDGIFACGNVVHVHDLVDFVTAESKRAGAAAAKYVLSGDAKSDVLRMVNGNGVTYTVPQLLRRDNIDKAADLFFRVNHICKESVIKVMDGDVQLCAFKREHLAPGEMEHIMLPKVILQKAKGDTLTILVEENAVEVQHG
ncbi:MAG: FAD-dependent oxidoreductase [Oscillospiraceae bacterium]